MPFVIAGITMLTQALYLKAERSLKSLCTGLRLCRCVGSACYFTKFSAIQSATPHVQVERTELAQNFAAGMTEAMPEA
jgi:hypothetical protein